MVASPGLRPWCRCAPMSHPVPSHQDSGPKSLHQVPPPSLADAALIVQSLQDDATLQRTAGCPIGLARVVLADQPHAPIARRKPGAHGCARRRGDVPLGDCAGEVLTNHQAPAITGAHAQSVDRTGTNDETIAGQRIPAALELLVCRNERLAGAAAQRAVLPGQSSRIAEIDRIRVPDITAKPDASWVQKTSDCSVDHPDGSVSVTPVRGSMTFMPVLSIQANRPSGPHPTGWFELSASIVWIASCLVPEVQESPLRYRPCPRQPAIHPATLGRWYPSRYPCGISSCRSRRTRRSWPSDRIATTSRASTAPVSPGLACQRATRI